MPSITASVIRLPDLRFVSVDSLVPHEQHDVQRSEPLTQRIREQGILRNPPIVAPIPGDPEGRLVVLDGANRVTALRAARLPHVVVQVVTYEDPQIRLSTWHHALVGFSQAKLEKLFGTLKGLERHPTDVPHARAVLARREAIAYVAYGPGQVFTLHGGPDLHQNNALLNLPVGRLQGPGALLSRHQRFPGRGCRRATPRSSRWWCSRTSSRRKCSAGDQRRAVAGRHHAASHPRPRVALERSARSHGRHRALARREESLARGMAPRQGQSAPGALLRRANDPAR